MVDEVQKENPPTGLLIEGLLVVGDLPLVLRKVVGTLHEVSPVEVRIGWFDPHLDQAEVCEVLPGPHAGFRQLLAAQACTPLRFHRFGEFVGRCLETVHTDNDDVLESRTV